MVLTHARTGLTSRRRRDFAAWGVGQERNPVMVLILLWLLGVPLGLILVLWLLGIGS
jgi:hypothetical protein